MHPSHCILAALMARESDRFLCVETIQLQFAVSNQLSY